MIRFHSKRWFAGLMLAALLIGGCGSPAPTPTATPEDPTPMLPSGPGTVLTPIYPGPDAPPPAVTPASPDTGYPAPANPAPANPAPYPEPTAGAAVPGGGTTSVTTVTGAPVTVDGQTVTSTTPAAKVSVVATYPHDPKAYTQGLVYIGGDTFYEGTGWYADSSLREVALATGAVSRQVLLSTLLGPDPNGNPAFGEGIAIVGERIFQLSWLNGAGLIYDLSFERVGQFTYPPPGRDGPVQGWGLTYDPASDRLIMSDGTATLYFVDPAETERTGILAITGQVDVHDAAGAPIGQLNELELVKGEIFANIYGADQIARIDPATGSVNSFLDLSDLRTLLPPSGPEVLNGIAYDTVGDRLFVTGKYWPSLFEIELPVAWAYLPAALVVPARNVLPVRDDRRPTTDNGLARAERSSVVCGRSSQPGTDFRMAQLVMPPAHPASLWS